MPADMQNLRHENGFPKYLNQETIEKLTDIELNVYCGLVARSLRSDKHKFNVCLLQCEKFAEKEWASRFGGKS